MFEFYTFFDFFFHSHSVSLITHIFEHFMFYYLLRQSIIICLKICNKMIWFFSVKSSSSALLFVLMLFITANQFGLLVQMVPIQMSGILERYRYTGVYTCANTVRAVEKYMRKYVCIWCANNQLNQQSLPKANR